MTLANKLTLTDKFVDTDGCHVFGRADDLDCIEDPELRARCRALVPDVFWEGKR